MGWPNRRTERGFSHFQSQGKSWAPVQALCKWALLTDSPFGFCKRQTKQKRKERSVCVCEVRTSSNRGYLKKRGRSDRRKRRSLLRGRRKKSEVEKMGAGADSSMTASSGARTWFTERKQPRWFDTAPFIFSSFVPFLGQTYFQSPGKSVDSSLFLLLGLLAGYPFQQTWWSKYSG